MTMADLNWTSDPQVVKYDDRDQERSAFLNPSSRLFICLQKLLYALI